MENEVKQGPTAKPCVSFGGEVVEHAMMTLVEKEPFFAKLLMGMTRTITTDIPTAAVNVTDTVNLYINPYFWNSLETVQEQVAVLKHECYHVIGNHFSRAIDLEPDLFNNDDKTVQERVQAMMDSQTINMAGDFAINEYLPNLPKKFKCFDKDGKVMRHPKKIKNDKGEEIDNPDAGKIIQGKPCTVVNAKKQYPNMEKLKNMEYYYSFLKDDQNKNGDKNSQGGQIMVIDDHSMWTEGAKDSEYVKETVKQVVNKAVEDSGGIGAGSIPDDVVIQIADLNRKTKDWRQELQRFVARTSEIIIESSRKRRNRRYGILFPGTKVFPKLHLAVAVDTSGSVRDEELEQFMCEIDKIVKQGAKVTVIECDANVNDIYEFDPRKPVDVKGRGGTRFIPAFDAAKKLEIDGLIYLTDGDNFEGDKLKKPNFPVLWALLPKCKVRYNWGSKTTVTVNNKK